MARRRRRLCRVEDDRLAICGAPGENTNDGFGAATLPTPTTLVVELLMPRSLVTVSVTLKFCCDVKMWLTDWPEDDVPSPKFQT